MCSRTALHFRRAALLAFQALPQNKLREEGGAWEEETHSAALIGAVHPSRDLSIASGAPTAP
jgi:hypothetical protein